MLLAWRCTREPRQKEPEELPMLESRLDPTDCGVFCGLEGSLEDSRAESHACGAVLGLPRLVDGPAASTCRSGRPNGRSPREEDQKRPLRGPERFFYVARRTDLCRI